MFGARHCCCATAGLLAQLAFTAPGYGSDFSSTVIVSSNTSDARLTRALILIRGELSALGLDVQVRVIDAPDAPPAVSETSSERVNLEVKEGAIVVRVFAAGASAPLLESVDLDGPEVTAEVIAVRTVEALRAARLLPSPDQRIPAPKPPAPPPPEERPPAARPAAPTFERPIPTVQLALGATFVQNSRGLPQPGVRAAVQVGPRWGFVALGAESSLSDLSFERTVGSAQVSRRTLFLQLGARVRLHRAWEVSARSGVSYIHYGASGVAQPGYLDQDLEHDTGAASLSVGGAYYFVRGFGVYLDFSGLLAFDAARIRLGDEDVVTLDRPSFALGAGVLLGAF